MRTCGARTYRTIQDWQPDFPAVNTELGPNIHKPVLETQCLISVCLSYTDLGFQGWERGLRGLLNNRILYMLPVSSDRDSICFHVFYLAILPAHFQMQSSWKKSPSFHWNTGYCSVECTNYFVPSNDPHAWTSEYRIGFFFFFQNLNESLDWIFKQWNKSVRQCKAWEKLPLLKVWLGTKTRSHIPISSTKTFIANKTLWAVHPTQLALLTVLFSFWSFTSCSFPHRGAWHCKYFAEL